MYIHLNIKARQPHVEIFEAILLKYILLMVLETQPVEDSPMDVHTCDLRTILQCNILIIELHSKQGEPEVNKPIH